VCSVPAAARSSRCYGYAGLLACKRQYLKVFRFNSTLCSPRYCIPACDVAHAVVAIYAACLAPYSIDLDGVNELTPPWSRSLYLILNDKRLRLANYTHTLSMQLLWHKVVHLSSAKLLTHTSLCFKGIPLEAIDLFIQLVAAGEVPEGKLVFMENLHCGRPCIAFSIPLRRVFEHLS
jgi:hypothetical protein